jgi:biopolymer transport protein TolR
MKIKTHPNVVPLCDILLVLLIIFMVISPMAETGIDAALPGEGINGPVGPVVLTVERDGLITVNHEKFADLETLEKRLTEIYLHRANKTIFVQAHEAVPYQRVIDAIDTAKHSGVDVICAIPVPLRSSTQP